MLRHGTRPTHRLALANMRVLARKVSGSGAMSACRRLLRAESVSLIMTCTWKEKRKLARSHAASSSLHVCAASITQLHNTKGCTKRGAARCAHAVHSAQAPLTAQPGLPMHEQKCLKLIYETTYRTAHHVTQRKCHMQVLLPWSSLAHSSFSRRSSDSCVAAAVFTARKAVSRNTAMCGMMVTRVSHERGSNRQPGASTA